MTETQQRFLKAIAERVNGGNIAEVRLYPTVRVGPIESGVAIVATTEPAVVVAGEGGTVTGGAGRETEDSAVESSEVPGSAAVAADSVTEPDTRRDRLSILTAHFRHTVKGPDRGKWEFTLVHDADAPIETVERVVRGVARRAGEDGEPELLSGTDFQRALTEPWWTSSQHGA
jgi:hypothetical protein